jgi:hypothetical protein
MSKNQAGCRALGFTLMGSVLLALTACGPRPVTARLSVQVSAASATEVTESAQVLLRRFEEFRPSYFSSEIASIEGNRIDIEFRGASPPEPVMRYLAGTQGVWRLAAADAPLIVWVTDRDILRAVLFKDTSGLSVNTRITPAAGARLLQLTHRNVGKVLVTTWDGRVILRATISGVFGEQFISPVPEGEDPRAYCAVLQHGRLPVPVASVEYQAVP